jgi:hypothetical protein
MAEDILKELFESYTGQKLAERIELSTSGSNRQYFRLKGGNISVSRRSPPRMRTCMLKNDSYGLARAAVMALLIAFRRQVTSFLLPDGWEDPHIASKVQY